MEALVKVAGNLVVDEANSGRCKSPYTREPPMSIINTGQAPAKKLKARA